MVLGVGVGTLLQQYKHHLQERASMVATQDVAACPCSATSPACLSGQAALQSLHNSQREQGPTHLEMALVRSPAAAGMTTGLW